MCVSFDKLVVVEQLKVGTRQKVEASWKMVESVKTPGTQPVEADVGKWGSLQRSDNFYKRRSMLGTSKGSSQDCLKDLGFKE